MQKKKREEDCLCHAVAGCGAMVLYLAGEENASSKYKRVLNILGNLPLDRNLVEILGSLDTTVSRYGISVTPYVGIIPPNPNLNESSSEIESYFRVPIS